MRDEAAASPAPEEPKTPEAIEAVENPAQSAIVEEIPSEPVRLCINANGASVYQMPDGSRIYSNNLGIMQVQDGDKLAPDMLYTYNRHEFLTIQEVSHFRNYTDLQVEVSNAPKTNRTSRNRPQGSQAGNDSGHQAGGYTSRGYSILDRWALNSPDKLRKLEAEGKIAFDLKLYGQQQTEARALMSPAAQKLQQNGLSDWEILQALEIETSLKITE